MLLNHPDTFRDGVRVLFLKSRNKDNPTRNITLIRITNNVDQFNRMLLELDNLALPGERIYSAASPRDMTKAVRHFKEAQLAADYDKEPLKFYANLEARWASSLMQPNCQIRDQKFWLFDCDTEEELASANKTLDQAAASTTLDTYTYPSKSGVHILCRPFNTKLCSDLSRNCLKQNAMMLWGWK
jgi:hypothetical protein